jgi:hypothetical protein
MEAVALFGPDPACCANPFVAQIKLAISKAPRSKYKTPSLSVRHNFNDSLLYRMDTPEQDQVRSAGGAPCSQVQLDIWPRGSGINKMI